MDRIKVRCRSCGKELEGHPSKTVSCGCPNMTTIRGDRISAVDLDQVVMLNSNQPKNKRGVLTQQDICLLYTSPSPRDVEESRMPSSA